MRTTTGKECELCQGTETEMDATVHSQANFVWITDPDPDGVDPFKNVAPDARREILMMMSFSDIKSICSTSQTMKKSANDKFWKRYFTRYLKELRTIARKFSKLPHDLEANSLSEHSMHHIIEDTVAVSNIYDIDYNVVIKLMRNSGSASLDAFLYLAKMIEDHIPYELELLWETVMLQVEEGPRTLTSGHIFSLGHFYAIRRAFEQVKVKMGSDYWGNYSDYKITILHVVEHLKHRVLGRVRTDLNTMTSYFQRIQTEDFHDVPPQYLNNLITDYVITANVQDEDHLNYIVLAFMTFDFAAFKHLVDMFKKHHTKDTVSKLRRSIQFNLDRTASLTGREFIPFDRHAGYVHTFQISEQIIPGRSSNSQVADKIISDIPVGLRSVYLSEWQFNVTSSLGHRNREAAGKYEQSHL